MPKQNHNARALPENRAAGPVAAETVLAEAVRTLAAWEAGESLADLLPHGGKRLLHNGLLTFFRRKATIDWILQRFVGRPPQDAIRHVLQWTVCQLLFVSDAPPAVVCSVAVDFVRSDIDRTKAGFVNAVLRRIVDAGREDLAADLGLRAPPWVLLNLSPALYAAWEKRFTRQDLETLAALLLEPAPLTVRRRRTLEAPGMPGHADTDKPSGATVTKPLPLDASWAAGQELFTVPEPEAFFTSIAFRRNAFYVQDPSTVLAPALLAVQPCERVADLCCAPGGKALLLAEAGPFLLFCGDRSARRLLRVRENLAGATTPLLVAMDAAAPPCPAATFDAVLADVPCSNTGVIRRRPDVRWRFAPAQLQELVALQAGILAGAAALVKPGGRLVYSTCSIEPEENGEQVQRFLAAHPEFTLATEKLLLPCPRHDGAYAALLLRGPASAP